MGQDPVAIITGGTSGIGLEAVKLFCRSGYRVFTCARHSIDFANHLDESQLTKLDFNKVDLANTAEFSEWIHSIGSQSSIDVMINNAAIVFKKPLQEFSTEEFQSSLTINLLSVMEGLKTALNYFDSKTGGVVINVSSMAAVDPFEGFSVYGACKAFLELFTQAMATELEPSNINCYSIRAGTVETPLLRRVLPEFPESETLPPSKVAALMLALAQRDPKFANGQAIEISIDNVESVL